MFCLYRYFSWFLVKFLRQKYTSLCLFYLIDWQLSQKAVHVVSSLIWPAPHSARFIKGGMMLFPLSVSVYSTLGGTSLYCSRWTMPDASNSLSDCANIMFVTPVSLRLMLLYLVGRPLASVQIIGSFHLPPTTSIA